MHILVGDLNSTPSTVLRAAQRLLAPARSVLRHRQKEQEDPREAYGYAFSDRRKSPAPHQLSIRSLPFPSCPSSPFMSFLFPSSTHSAKVAQGGVFSLIPRQVFQVHEVAV
mmetsp:Transcript_24598/g.80618  ORF Transcript_24598/g.80618 Transcript_24598/m.80618 type:complete len:111 (-) Transcript_24598:144-476(-)